MDMTPSTLELAAGNVQCITLDQCFEIQFSNSYERLYEKTNLKGNKICFTLNILIQQPVVHNTL